MARSEQPKPTSTGEKWRRPIPLVLIGIAVLFGLIQLVPYRTHNPPVRQEPPWNSPQTRTLAVAACYDCHSNETKKRWYENVAPISWWTNNHVQDGRSVVNFSEWDPNNHIGGHDFVEVLSERSMPPRSYLWFGLHPAAKLTQAERDQLGAGLEATFGRTASPLTEDQRNGR